MKYAICPAAIPTMEMLTLALPALCKNCNFLRRRIGRRDRTIKQKNEKILDLERKLLVYRKLNRRIQAQAEAATASFDNANAVIRLMGGVGVCTCV